MGAVDLVVAEVEFEDMAGPLELAVMDLVDMVTVGSEAATD